MKKIKKKVFALCVVVLIMAGMTTAGYANSGNYVNLKSERGNLENVIRISNVVGTDSKEHVINHYSLGTHLKDYSIAYFCNSPAEVKILGELSWLSIKELKANKDGWVRGNDVEYNYKLKTIAKNTGKEVIINYKDYWRDVDDKFEYTRTILSGEAITLTKKGAYLVYTMKGNDSIIAVIIIDNDSDTSANNDIFAAPTTSKVLVNGNNKAFDAYTINGSNYFKLRDIAYTLSGSAKQFDVAWDGMNDAIKLTSNKSYKPVGGEMESKKKEIEPATPTTSKILLDGSNITLTAYNIGDSNYFKLRDIGQAFDFGVKWNGTRNTIAIDTAAGYSE